MTESDREEFIAYLKGCTDRQVVGVYEKEMAAGRKDYAELAKHEAELRRIEL